MHHLNNRSSFALLSAAILVFIAVSVVRVSAAQNNKPLREQEVIELLKGGVASPHVASIVDDRGIDFDFTEDVERSVRNAGGGSDVVSALRRASERRQEVERPRTGGLIIKTKPGETQVYLNDEPKGMTSPEGEIRLPELQPGNYKLRVSTPGYQSYEESMPVTAGEDQTVYVTLVQKSTIQPVQPVQNIPVPDQPAPLFIPGIQISPLKFFEGPHDKALDQNQRAYATQFDHTTARSIYWEIDLSYPAPGRRIDFNLDAYWYRPDGSLLRHQVLPAYVEPTWPSSYHTLGYGWVDAGHWPLGLYRVEIQFKGVRVVSGNFQIN